MPRDRASRDEPLHGEQLPGEVRDVAEMQHLGLRRDRLLEPLIQVVLRRRHRELDARDLDLVAPHALVPRRQHARVVLLGRQHFVARLHVDAVLRDLHRLAGVARQRQLRRIAAELGGQAAPHRADVPADPVVVLHRQHVGHVHVALDRLVDDARARTAVAVIQIGQRPVERERFLDLAPVELVGGDILWRAIRDGRGRRRDLRDRLERRVDQGGRADAAAQPQKVSSVQHVSSPFHYVPRWRMVPEGGATRGDLSEHNRVLAA